MRLILAFISTTAFFLSSGYVEDFYTRNQNEIDLKLLYENDVDKVIVARTLSSPLLQKEHQVIEKHLGKENVTNAFGNIDDNFLDVSKNVPVQRDQFKKFGLLEIPQNNNYLKLVPDKRLENVASSLPKNENEIALTSYQADCYMKYGYRDNDNKTVELKSREDLIGKKLERFTIIGIFENPSFKEGGVSKDYIVKKYGKEEAKQVLYEMYRAQPCEEDARYWAEKKTRELKEGKLTIYDFLNGIEGIIWEDSWEDKCEYNGWDEISFSKVWTVWMYGVP